MDENKDQIQEVKSRIDIVEIISEYVNLKKRGNNHVGLCPFHREKTPSFSVSQDRQFYHCFGCGAGGDVFNFLMEIENMGFSEALNYLADRAGVILKTYSRNPADEKRFREQKNLKEKIYEVNLEAAKYFYLNLKNPEAKHALDYIKKRKINSKSLKEYLIGYAGRGLYEYLKRKGHNDKEIFESGLVLKNENGTIYDRFYDRLMFTIFDIRGNIIGFSGRTLSKEKNIAKYINTSENIVYTKGEHLFGMQVAKKYCKEELILVEGNIDVISLHQRGFENTVAPLGTAFTKEQANLIKGKTEKIIIAFDDDEAGRQATIRALDILKATNIDLRVVEFVDAKDADEYILNYGTGPFKERLISAISEIEFRVKVLKEKIDLEGTNSSNDKIKFLKELSKIIAEIDGDLEREIYIDKISKEYNVHKDSIYLEINKIRAKKSKSIDSNELRNPYLTANKRKTKEENKSKSNDIEELIIYLLINEKNKFDEIIVNISPDNIKNEENLKTINYIISKGKDCKFEDLILNLTDNDILDKITKVGMMDLKLDVSKTISDIFKTYRQNDLKERNKEILIELSNLRLKVAKDENEKNEIENQRNELEKELLEIIIEIGKLKK